MFRPLLLVALTAVILVTASTHHPHHHHHHSTHDTSSLPSTLEIRIALHHRNWDVFQTHFQRITDIHDDMYGKWMTIEEMSDMIGITKQDETSVRHMLRDLGATNIHLSASRDFISCEMPTAVARHMIDDISNAHQLYAHVSRSHHDAMRHISFAWRSPSSSSSSSSSSVSGTYKKHHTPRKANYVGFDKFQARLDEINNKIRAGHHQLAAEMLADDPTSGTPQNQWAAYGVPTGTRGSNNNNSQLVWGTGTYGYTASDLSSYYSTYNIQDEDRFVLSNGPYQPAYPGVPGGDNFGEGTLDVTLITGLAPGILTVVSNTDNSTSSEEGYGFGPALLNFVTYLASNPTIPNVISMSLGSLSWDSCNILCTQVSLNGGNITYQQCVDYMQQQRQVCMYPDGTGIDRINDEFQKLGARGITLLAATGDGGSHFSFQRFNIFDPIGAALNTVSCAFNFPTFPAASPWVTGVGGVDWSQGGYTNPQPWVASGSGFSWRFPMPTYQKDFVQNYLKNTPNLPPASAFNASNRAYPDVAALATNVPIVMSGFLSASGGTSASTPAFAALISLINDARLNANLPPLGFVNPRLYDIARKSYAEAFVDLTTGSSACDSAGFCCSSGFPAATGWDPTTGLGSPLFPGLLKHLGTDN